MRIKNELNNRRANLFFEIKTTRYESIFYYSRLIHHLMSLNKVREGEISFDKLSVLSANIIDFIIRSIDTKTYLIYIIDSHIKSLIF